jgi:hypothetical protein
VLNKDETTHPVLTGVKDIFGPSDVYGASAGMLEKLKATPLVYGQILESLAPDAPPVKGGQDNKGNVRNDPMMPVVWTCRHVWPNGKSSQILTSTLGCSQDFVHEGLRRIIVNACYWATGLQDSITKDLDCDFVGDYKPTPFKGRTKSDEWTRLALSAEKLR